MQAIAMGAYEFVRSVDWTRFGKTMVTTATAGIVGAKGREMLFGGVMIGGLPGMAIGFVMGYIIVAWFTH